MKNLFYKAGAALALAPFALTSFAEETGGTVASDISFDSAGEMVQTVIDGLKEFVTDHQVAIIGVAAAFLGFWLVKIVIRVIKGMASTGK